MQQQLAEMRGSSVQTDKIVNSNADLAVAAKAQAVAQAQSAETAQEALTMNQRASIAVLSGTIQTLQEGVPLKATLTYANTGREASPVDPSMSATEITAAEFKQTMGAEHILKRQGECLATTNIIGAVMAFPAGIYKVSLNAAEIEQASKYVSGTFTVDRALIDGGSVLIVTGCFPYSTLKNVHHVFSCYYYKSTTTREPSNLNICSIGNIVD